MPARRVWRQLPHLDRSDDSEAVRAAADAVLHVVDTAVATLAEGYAVARRELVRREESLRRELVDDLLRGDSDLGGLVERAEPFGLDLARVHQVALAAPGRRLPDTEAAISALERVIFDRLGDRDVLVATKEGLLVVIAPADATGVTVTPPTTSASAATQSFSGRPVIDGSVSMSTPGRNRWGFQSPSGCWAAIVAMLAVVRTWIWHRSTKRSGGMGTSNTESSSSSTLKLIS